MKLTDRFRVMVIDDSSEEVRVMLDNLSENYEVFFALNGPEALEIAEREHPDLTLLDIYMKGMDGFEVCKRMKSIPEIADNPIIFITGSSDKADHVKGLEIGAVDFISKPINIAVLKQRVKLHLRLKSTIETCLIEVDARKQAEEKYREIVRYAPAAIFELDMESLSFISVNDVMCKYTGCTKDELMERDLYSFLSKSDEQKVKSLFERVTSDEKNLSPVEYTIYGKDGQEWPVMVNSKFYYDNGTPKKVMMVLHDVTEIRKAEEERLKLESQLRHSQKMQIIGTLAGGVAHNFNNLLMPILGFSELIQKKLDPKTKEYTQISYIIETAKRAKELVSQILIFSRQEEVKKEKVQLAVIVKEVLNIIRSTLPSNISLKQAISEEVPSIIGDSSQLHQVFMNLCINAAHAMPGGGELLIKVENVNLHEFTTSQGQVLSGSYVVSTIQDIGLGMDEEALSQIFNPFYTTKEADEATGLGLTSVLGIVEQHQGGIDVKSEVMRGTTFNIYFPTISIIEEKATFHEKEETGISKGERSILLVEDEKYVRKFFKEVLESEENRFRVTEAENGKEALEIFQKYPQEFDLIITDHMMPDMTGTQLSEKVRELGSDIQIIMCTGYGELAKDEKVKQSGVNEVIMKPCDSKTLTNTIQRALDMRKA